MFSLQFIVPDIRLPGPMVTTVQRHDIAMNMTLSDRKDVHKQKDKVMQIGHYGLFEGRADGET
jgi:hypothetical protein